MASWRLCPARRKTKGFVYLAITLVFLLSLHILIHSARRYDAWTWTSCNGLSPFDASCTTSRATLAQDVQIVVKTGGSEPQGRLHTQLATMLSKIPRESVIILSDMEESIGPHHVHNVYANITEQERADYPEFALYDAQQDRQRRGLDTRSMRGGWDLAKYMNLAMLRTIRAMQPDSGKKKWFVFIDTDTFIDWDNLLTLLEHQDPAKQEYIGSPVWLPGLQFAHGGSAYALSSWALNALNYAAQSPQEPLYSQFGFNTTELCCGDEALARVLRTKGVRLKGYWPMFNGETPATLSFGRDLWCEPVVSLHHLGENEMRQLWQWVEEWKVRITSSRPLLYRDLFHYIAPNLTNMLHDWHNIDERTAISPRKNSHKSLHHCEEACEADKSCLQFVYDGEACTLSHHIRLGKARASEGTRKFVSGWNLFRIRDFTSTRGCESAHWVRSNP